MFFSAHVSDDSKYVLSEMRSGVVTASTLTIPNFQARSKVDLEVVISARDGTQQYQLRTRPKKGVEWLAERIDSPEWMIVPPNAREFQPGSLLVTQCKVFVPHEGDVSYTNECDTCHNKIPGECKSI